MKWKFNGMGNWPEMEGRLDMLQGFDVFRASDSSKLPRDVCEGCVVWRENGCCAQVQVDDWIEDAQHKRVGGYEGMEADCLVSRNCCPILFFDFIGATLPRLEFEE